MISYKDSFESIQTELKGSDIWKQMELTVEGSKWHREANVAVHTEMVLDQFFSRIANVGDAWGRDHYVCAIVLLFHDTGKPGARTEKYSEERGHYVGFGGHELLSARIFEDWAVTNWNKYFKDIIHEQDIYGIVWLIQNHLPYNVTKHSKLEDMRKTIFAILDDPNMFKTMVLSDQYGRISDDHTTNKLAIHDWFDLTLGIVRKPAYVNPANKIMYVLVGAPGTGKSTYTKKLLDFDSTTQVYNLDTLRLQWYPCEETNEHAKYRHAFNESCEDKQFESKAREHFLKLISTKSHIIIDNTNTSDKRRNQLLQLGRQHGYYIIVVLFPVTKKTLLERNKIRLDHTVPDSVILSMYDRISYPTLGSNVDTVKVINSNII